MVAYEVRYRTKGTRFLNMSRTRFKTRQAAKEFFDRRTVEPQIELCLLLEIVETEDVIEVMDKRNA